MQELAGVAQSWIETRRVAPTVAIPVKDHTVVTEEEIPQLIKLPVPPEILERNRSASGLLFLSAAGPRLSPPCRSRQSDSRTSASINPPPCGSRPGI